MAARCEKKKHIEMGSRVCMNMGVKVGMNIGVNMQNTGAPIM